MDFGAGAQVIWTERKGDFDRTSERATKVLNLLEVNQAALIHENQSGQIERPISGDTRSTHETMGAQGYASDISIRQWKTWNRLH